MVDKIGAPGVNVFEIRSSHPSGPYLADGAALRRSPNLSTNIIPAKIAWLKAYGKLPMDIRLRIGSAPRGARGATAGAASALARPSNKQRIA